jgi:acetoacetate decarboxylase
MGYKHHELDPAPLLKNLIRPNFMTKIIPNMDCTPHICELTCYNCEDVTLKGAWSGPVTIQRFESTRSTDVTRLCIAGLPSGR